MAQCERILEGDERCSNQAVPGTRYCKTHGRITFRPVGKPADTAPPPEPTAAPDSAGPEGPAAPEWRAAPSPAGQEPVFPGLHTDDRNILVAPQGVIWLPAGQESTPREQFNRLVRVMGFLSQTLDVTGQVNLLRQSEAGDAIIILSPAQDGESGLSTVYDAASTAARLVDGRLYIGQDNVFVQYRDDRAPRGYDVPDFEPPEDKERLLLVARWGSRLLTPTDFDEVPLAGFCLQVAPLPDVSGPSPEQVYALAPPPLYLILARYFRAHHLRYGLTRLQAPEGELILFEISPRPDAPAGDAVPSFVLDYLARLPRVALLTQVHQVDNRRFLLQWRHRFPLNLSHIAGAFAPDDMVLLVADPYLNQRVNPAPQFFDGDQLIDVHVPQPVTSGLTPQPADESPKLLLPVLLRADQGPTPPIAALILSAQEMEWIRQLLYRLPGDAFGAYSVCLGQDRTVLLGGTLPIEGLPFGLPLRRLSDAGLFIPLRSRLVPDLPWGILRQALGLQDDVYTFLTQDYRLDLPVADFAPLSRALVADPHHPRIDFDLRLIDSIPDPVWTSPPAPPVEEKELPRGSTDKEPGEIAPPYEAPVAQDAQLDISSHLRGQARAYEEADDFLAAALCYSLLNDASNSARCYRRAAALSTAKTGARE